MIRQRWQCEQLVGVLPTSNSTGLRYEVTARNGRGFVVLSHLQKLKAGGQEVWQELILPVELVGDVMAWLDRAAAQCEGLPGVRGLDELIAENNERLGRVVRPAVE